MLDTLFQARKNVRHRRGIEPEMVVLANIHESHDSRLVQNERCGVWHPNFDAFWLLLQDSEIPNELTLRIRQKEDSVGQPHFIDEDPTAGVDLSI